MASSTLSPVAPVDIAFADVPHEDLLAHVLELANRHNPYPLYARLRERPVALQRDGTYVISTYREISTLLHDPRISSDERKSAQAAASSQQGKPSFLFLDPPDHDRLRRIVMRQFSPARVLALHADIVRLVDELLDAQRGQTQFDVVEDLAYPLPVAVICALLGVPREDEPSFQLWAGALARTLDPPESMSDEEVQQARVAIGELRAYFATIMAARRAEPKDDLISGFVAGDGSGESMDENELLATFALLLIAGHETTVNLIANGTLALLREPALLARLRDDPRLAIPLVEELLRYDPPVQFRKRTTLTEIEVAGTTIPKGASVIFLLSSGSRDPLRFVDADRLVPDRVDNQHLGFGGGIHYCVGAPLARIEVQIALNALVRRLVNPRLLADPPPYRENAALRGPSSLPVGFDGVVD